MNGLISALQRISFNLANFIFGKSAIFVVIVGWYLTITGLLFLVKPENIRSKLVRSGFGILKVNILLVCFFLWGLLTKISRNIPGILQSVVFLGGLVGLVMFFFRGRAFAKEKLVSAVGRLPVNVLTIIAWGQVLVGSLMVYLQRRIW